MLLIAYWLVAIFRGRAWILSANRTATIAFTCIALIISVSMEIVMIRYLHRYSYGTDMPVVPVLEVGLSPFLQWLAIPPLLLWFMHRQLT